MKHPNILSGNSDMNLFDVKKLKFICLFVLVIVVTIIVIFYFSNNLSTQIKNVKVVIDYNEDTLIEQMDTIKFGSYPQTDITGNKKEPIEWLVLEKKENKALLLSKYILDCKCYDYESYDATWETSDLRDWLNNDFYHLAFSKKSELDRILVTNVMNSDNTVTEEYGGKDTYDELFCLNVDEIIKYFGNYTNNENKYRYQFNKRLMSSGTNYAKAINNNGETLYIADTKGEYSWYNGYSGFWLRIPGNTTGSAAFVSYTGSINLLGTSIHDKAVGVRPALWVEY